MLTAGTGDAAVAEECRRTAELMGCYVFRLQVPVSVVGVASPETSAFCPSNQPTTQVSTHDREHREIQHLTARR